MSSFWDFLRQAPSVPNQDLETRREEQYVPPHLAQQLEQEEKDFLARNPIDPRALAYTRPLQQPMIETPQMSAHPIVPVDREPLPIRPEALQTAGTIQKTASPATDMLYDAIIHAETGSQTDPWIRTKVVPPEGSSAYGPAQLTQDLAIRFKKKKDLFTEEEHEYLDKFIEQGDKFLKYGTNPHYDIDTTKLEGYDKRYEYGGSGDLTTDEDKELYNQVTKKMLRYIAKEQNYDMTRVWKEWKLGKEKVDDPNTTDDTKYLGRLMDYLETL